ncbi:MAG: DUF1419 domain-containing protein [Mesorhizobium sp.]|uniref:DUF1419 domain-containing protein n=2 Tax=Mesorhizobium sp. TaxID=1871066 RepID=UPI000FE6CCFC|nr:DUF1419 domain-containing protein [Mesorhizobium sp.]RWJ42736.1 MAG: DUF1419 domain-containing protein [Mesorhizobium sp.]RWJ58141.1 MAG: DUF1419 domain-containing protein [Mesorhizobium sp.]RWJ63955.1 MAG: DUF1419 domain-containing protein [Mesorhizobium sp.]RWJ93832.1 MAG: DUF1419 domain-containing protein [Mesorhizobium sp.]
MNPTSRIRKIYQGVADRRQMFRLFDRHAQRPNRWQNDDSALFAGEWFEIARPEHDYMLDILPPLWMHGDMFAMREFLTDSVTSTFFALTIDGRIRYFHGYCDLFQRGFPDRMKAAIVERESRPVRAMTREERIEHIWSSTHDDYRGYAGERWQPEHRGKRTVLVYGRGRTELKLLDHLSDEEIAAKLPVHLRHLPLRAAA